MAAELLTRQFTREIQPQLFKWGGFLDRAINDDAFVNNNTVELAHSGTIPAVAVDRSSLPATIAKRTDAATNYTLAELTTDPTLLQDSEGLTVAYNKRQSILNQHTMKIKEKAANLAIYAWAAGATSFVPSTGTTRAANGPSQTGNRKGIAKNDIIELRQRFFEDDIVGGMDGIQGIALITPAQYSDLLKISEFVDGEKYGRSNIPSGVVSRAFGFDFYIRSSVAVTNASDALKAEGAAAAATDQDAAIFYSPEFVRKAKGAVKVYVDNDKPEYYGSVFSTMLRFGATFARNDNKGIYLLFEDTV